MVYFSSDRMIFRDWKDEDLQEFQIMNADPSVMQYFLKPLSHTETDSFFEGIKAEFIREGYGLYAVELKKTGEFIGFIGFHKANLNLGFDPFVEIGWRLKQEVWGNGYASEGAKRCLEYGFKHLQLHEVYSFTSCVNTRSENVMKKIGMVKKLEFEHPRIERNHVLSKHTLYHISRE